MVKHTFKVKRSQNAKSAVTITVDMPSSLTDTDLITKRFGSVERMIDRANGQWTVDAQRGCRAAMTKDDDQANAQASAEAFCDDGRKAIRPTMSAKQVKDLKLNAEQIAAIRASGMTIA